MWRVLEASCSFVLQVVANGFVSMSNGLQVLAGGVTVGAGLTATQIDVNGGDFRSVSGTLSISSSAASTTVLDVSATAAGYTGDMIRSRQITTTGNALVMLEGNNAPFVV